MPGRAPRGSANMVGHDDGRHDRDRLRGIRSDTTGPASPSSFAGDRSRRASLLEAAIARVEARNRAVNAVTMPLYDYGRAAISKGLPDGPFTGVPFLMKDLSAAIAGVPMTRSSRFFADAPAPAADSEHVARLKRAGLVIFGRTNTCELGLSLTCEPRLHGPTRNPWDLDAHLRRLERRRRGSRRARACSRWRMRRTASARSARRPRAAVWWASSPRAGAIRWRPGLGEGLGGCSIEHAVTLSVRDSRGAARRDERPGRAAILRRAAAGPALPAGSRRRSGRAAHRLHEPRAERREDRGREPARARRGREALRRPRPSGRGSRSGRSNGAAVVSTFLTLAAANTVVNLASHPTKGRAAARRTRSRR